MNDEIRKNIYVTKRSDPELFEILSSLPEGVCIAKWIKSKALIGHNISMTGVVAAPVVESVSTPVSSNLSEPARIQNNPVPEEKESMIDSLDVSEVQDVAEAIGDYF